MNTGTLFADKPDFPNAQQNEDFLFFYISGQIFLLLK